MYIHVFYQNLHGELFKVWMVFRFVDSDLWQLNLYHKHKRYTKVLFWNEYLCALSKSTRWTLQNMNQVGPRPTLILTICKVNFIFVWIWSEDIWKGLQHRYLVLKQKEKVQTLKMKQSHFEKEKLWKMSIIIELDH